MHGSRCAVCGPASGDAEGDGLGQDRKPEAAERLGHKYVAVELNLDRLKECEIKLAQKVDDQDIYMSLPETAWNKENFPAQT